MCPRMFEYATIKKIPRGISEAESFGSSVHNALKRWGEMEIEASGGSKHIGNWQLADDGQLGMFKEEKEANSQLLTAKSLLELWHQSFIIDTYVSRVEADFARERGEKLMAEFFEWSRLRSSPSVKATGDRSRSGGQGSGEAWKVIAVEKSFAIDVNGSVLKGRFDRVESDGDAIRVIDFKTSSPSTQEEVDADLQLSIYALAAEEVFDKPCSKLMFLFLSEDEVVERVTTRNASQLKDARKQIQVLAERIEAKDFHPTPSVSVCRCCPYKGVCDVAAITSTP